jgi:hypothetical protein
MKSIVKGNNFALLIPVRRMEEGQMVAMPLAVCEEIHVRLVSAVRRFDLAFVIEDEGRLRAQVPATLPIGTYALEVCGKLLGTSWRSNEYEQIRIVDNNAMADTVLSEVDDNEPSVEIDTQVVVYAAAPQLLPCGEWVKGKMYAVGSLVSHGLCCWQAVEVTSSEPKKGSTSWVVMLDGEPLKEVAKEAAGEAVKSAISVRVDGPDLVITVNDGRSKGYGRGELY